MIIALSLRVRVCCCIFSMHPQTYYNIYLQVDNIPVTCIPTNAIIIQSCHVGMLSIYIIYYPRIKQGCDSDSGFRIWVAVYRHKLIYLIQAKTIASCDRSNLA